MAQLSTLSGMTTPRSILLVPLLAVILTASLALSQSRQYPVVPLAKLRQMAPFQAQVDQVMVFDPQKMKIFREPEVWIWLKMTDDSRLTVVVPAATTQHIAFARSLQLSNIYSFPKVWDDFDRQKK